MTKEEEEDYSRPQYFLKCFYLYESYTEHVINASLLHISHIDDDVFDSPSLSVVKRRESTDLSSLGSSLNHSLYMYLF